MPPVSEALSCMPWEAGLVIWGPGVSDECVDCASSAPGVKAPEGNPVDEGGRAPGCRTKERERENGRGL